MVFTIRNIYGPYAERQTHWKKIFNLQYLINEFVLGGDFNVVFH
jgi:hypothetical protein